MYLQSFYYYAPKYIDYLSEATSIKSTPEEKQQALDYVYSNAQNPSVLGLQNFIFWFIIIIALIVFLLSSRSIIRKEYRKWKGKIGDKRPDRDF